ncbi:hypothetical protein CLOM_g325 [Closterium sp. NIES-68]|nr:hypothetical protein CLOM_g325 [Closterium sp. NIES-68]GJP71913.1 hypothetical protein CLOP_g2702 [Closterium sp. NIES-67]GJP80170.1 hypothetical protein CLOP_g10393 [Closterium sp. NIES-67]
MAVQRNSTAAADTFSSKPSPTSRKRKLVFGSESIPERSRRVRYSLDSASTTPIFGTATGRFDDYFVLCSATPLGSGRFGAVRKCVCKATGQAFARKTLQKRELIGEAGRDDVRREVRMLQQVAGHPGIVQLHAVFEDETEVHLVTELCDGGELFDDVVRRWRLPEKEAAQVFMQVASAVAFCHSRGIVHRDVKPENILFCFDKSHGPAVEKKTEVFSPAGASGTNPVARKSAFVPEPAPHLRVKLADFGLALSIGRDGRARGAAGSPYYMAPEVFTGEYGCAADVWSLGVVLHVLLCGAVPFWGADEERTIESVLTGRLDLGEESAAWAGARVSAEARGLIRCMLERDPRRRPSASKVLSHPWLLLHAFGGRIVRKAVRGEAAQAAAAQSAACSPLKQRVLVPALVSPPANAKSVAISVGVAQIAGAMDAATAGARGTASGPASPACGARAEGRGLEERAVARVQASA